MKCIINGDLLLVDIPAEEKVSIKNELTFGNPAYFQAKKYSKWGYTNIPQFLHYFSESNKGLRVPIGMLNKVKATLYEDNRVHPYSKYPEFKLKLRDDQKEAADKYHLLNFSPYKQNGVIQMPTGKGKSILAIYLAQSLHTPTLVIVHKSDLVTSWKKDILSCFDFPKGDNPVGIIKSKDYNVSRYITIATIQTLNRLSNEKLSDLYRTFGCIIQDEGHHCPASSYSLTSHFLSAFRICLTATPERNDGLTHVISLYYGDFSYEYRTSNTRKEVDILPVKVIKRIDNVSYDPFYEKVKTGNSVRYIKATSSTVNRIRLSQIPYDSRPQIPFHKLDRISCNELLPIVIDDVLKEYNKGRSCIVFFTQKHFCEYYREELLRCYVPTADIGLFYGDQSEDVNKEVLSKAQGQRKYITLSTYAKATEGTNVPQWEVAFFVSSINNGKNTEQASGRIRRSYPDKINPVIIYDYRTPNIYSMSNHGRTRDVRYEKLGFTFDTKS